MISTPTRQMQVIPEDNKIILKRSKNYLGEYVNYLCRRIYSLDAENIIINMLKDDVYDFVWFDERKFGSTIRKIKCLWPTLPVLTFYHSVIPSDIIFHNAYRGILHYIVFKQQERLSAQYSDASIILNERDRKTLRKHYGHDADLILPICYIDTATIYSAARNSDEFNILFVGGWRHKPNREGIIWFVKNVMPYLDRKAVLLLAGMNMKMCLDIPEIRDNDRIKVFSDVENLDEVYNMADLVISPIFTGAGMMTKIAEAMMYGKNYLATTHALCGYDADEICRCDTAEEFITRINHMVNSGFPRFNPAMRKLYEDKYSVNAMSNTLAKFFRQKGII